MRDDRERLRDILEAIEHIEKYAVQGRARFEQDELVRTWMIHHLQILGEAANLLSEDLRANYTEIEWSEWIGMRNILVHRYFGIDMDIVWNAVANELPDFKRYIEMMLQELT